MKPILPQSGPKFSAAVAFHNRRTDGTPSSVSVPIHELGLDASDGYHVRELFDQKDFGLLLPSQLIKVDVNPSGKEQIIIFFIFLKI